MSSWAPLLEGAAAERAERVISAIAADLGDTPEPEVSAHAPLATGEAGVALFFAYLDRVRPEQGWGEIATLRLDRAAEGLAARPSEPSLYSGFLGVAWALEHLQAEANPDEDPNEEIDEVLLDHLAARPWRHHFDLTGGLAGFGLYVLERLPRPSARRCLERVVEHFRDLAAPRPGGVTWPTRLDQLQPLAREWYPRGYDNLGLAHGAPGVIGVLARAIAAGVARDSARELLDPAVSWLLAQRLSPNPTSLFPYCVGDEVRLRPSRTAWCYGDPGVAAALGLAAEATGNAAWATAAREVARAVAHRAEADCGVHDAGFCHGEAGLAHVLHRLARNWGDDTLAMAARGWFDRVLARWQPGVGVGGFLAWGPPPEDATGELDWRVDRGFLTGSAGIGLTLLAAVSDVEPAWDRVLLLSSRGPGAG